MRLALVLYILLVIGGYDFVPNALFMDTAAFPDEDDDDDK